VFAIKSANTAAAFSFGVGAAFEVAVEVVFDVNSALGRRQATTPHLAYPLRIEKKQPVHLSKKQSGDFQ
jgi:hypothetical protein